MPSTQTRFGLTCAAILLTLGLLLASNGVSDWGLFAVGALLATISLSSWYRERLRQVSMLLPHKAVTDRGTA